MIGIINYGVGNIQAFINVYKRLGINAVSITTPNQIDQVDKLILPGVGHFDFAMSKFLESGLKARVEERVFNEGIPVLGVCVGMQMLAESSEEGEMQGLGWIPGEVKKFTIEEVKTKPHVPHMGWNTFRLLGTNDIFNGTDDEFGFYFVHSFYFDLEEEIDSTAKTTYGIEFTSAIRKGNIVATQFHPEKSHSNGVTLLKNFAEQDLC